MTNIFEAFDPTTKTAAFLMDWMRSYEALDAWNDDRLDDQMERVENALMLGDHL